MSRSALQPDHAALVIQDLFEWFPKHCINGTNGPSATPNCPFMPLPDLEAYLKAEKRTARLLDAIYFEREHQVIVENLEKWYIRVFTILTLIGKGRYIEHFAQYQNLHDTRLPFLVKPAHFPIDPNDPTFWGSFYERQFAFCAHYFCYNESHTKLEDLCILPIISKEVLGHRGSATIHKIKLHSCYDQLDPAADVSRVYGARPANTYVLKTYSTKDARSYFNNEVYAFKKLATRNRIDQSLIQFLGSYRQGNTYNILLEYADCGTLEEFFHNVTPPSLGEDIAMFWGKLFNVIKALSRIHAIERPDGFRGPDILIGWHQYVKPKNILIFSGKSSHPYDVEFKLADLGLSHFNSTANLDPRNVDVDTGGTKDYDAPECHRSDELIKQSKLTVKPSVDIWSFGGVCSEAAVWVVLGMSELIRYRSRRQKEICEKSARQDGSCFHDGKKILKTVEIMHDRLLKRGEVRPPDYVTIPILDQMVTSMLDEDSDRRPNAILLWKISQKILNKAQLELEASDQPITPRQGESSVDKEQSFGMKMPETSPPTLHGAHGPPPHYPQYSSNFQLPARPSFVKQTPRRRSGTWHEHSNIPDMPPGPLYGNPSFTSDEAGQRSPPKTLHLPPMANTTAEEPPAQKIKPEKPYLSYMDAKQIREKRSVLPRQARDLLNDLEDRDHLFLMDDSLSMKDHWDDVISLFSVLAYFAKTLNRDGLAMSFTVSLNKETFKNTSPAVSHLRSIEQSTYSNINLRLGQILWRYRSDLEHQRERKGSFWPRAKPVKPLSLYIFTDAAWQGCDAVPPIEAMIEKQIKLALPKEQVGIQFVRFGNDPIGIKRLKYLDSGLRKKYTKRWDIVDTEPFPDGNLLKMLLGAISPWFDDDDDDDEPS